MTELALEIVHYAVLDWRKMVAAKAWEKDFRRNTKHYHLIPNTWCNFDELRQFFKSEWCDQLLSTNRVATTGERILAMLEAELDDAIAKDNRKKRRGKK